jgi:integrase/recombinase XerD
VKLYRKGGKTRLCPLWPRTMAVLAPLIAGRPLDRPVFLNRYGAPVTRFGIHTLIERHAKQASERVLRARPNVRPAASAT